MVREDSEDCHRAQDTPTVPHRSALHGEPLTLPDLEARVALVLARERGVVEGREEAGGMPSPAWWSEDRLACLLYPIPGTQSCGGRGDSKQQGKVCSCISGRSLDTQASKGCSQNLQAKGRLLTPVQSGVRS